MKKLFFYITLTFFLSKIHAQKPTLQLETYSNWPEVRDGGISNDGKFAFYQNHNIPINRNTYTIRSIKGSLKKEILTDDPPTFSDDSRLIISKLPGDSLYILDLYNGNIKKIPQVSTFRILEFDRQNWLFYINNSHDLVIQSLNSKTLYTYHNVLEFEISLKGGNLVIKQLESTTSKKEIIHLFNLTLNKGKIIFEGEGVSHFTFDDEGQQIAFFSKKNNLNELWYYKIGTETAILKIEDQSFKYRNNNFIIAPGSNWGFSKNGKMIFFSYLEKTSRDVKSVSNLEIWSYKDTFLKSFYYGRNIFGLSNIDPLEYLTVFHIDNEKIEQLLHGRQEIISGSFKHETDSIFLVSSIFEGGNGEWNHNSRISYYICHTNSGELKPIELDLNYSLPEITLSPSGKYVVYFDSKTKNYYSYLVASGVKKSITKNIEENWVNYSLQDYPRSEGMIVGVVGWIKNDSRVLINGAFDIWSVDPLNEESPVNLTNYQGIKNRIIFYPLSDNYNIRMLSKERILVSAFDLNNKNYGFYEIDISSPSSLKKLYVGPIFSGHIENGYSQLAHTDLIKSKNSSTYMIRLESVNKSPNYFITENFITYSAFSDLQPQKQYNWMTSELHEYKDSLGNTYQGILYKPENFDPNKSYPVVFNYYILKSNLLNSFPKPRLTAADITISLLVSNGYLVFLPDIYAKIKHPGDGAVLSLIAAADHLSTYSWVKANKMAIVGSSFGGFETNYIITHTNRFTAAISGSGISDMISFASGIWSGGSSQQSFAQNTALKMQSTLSEDKDTYIRNSPILNAAKVETPLLLMHNTKDAQVPYLQSRSFFIILRELQKEVWWLNYNAEGHGILKKENLLDYHKKVFDFLDYYLKEKSEPEWMKEHI